MKDRKRYSKNNWQEIASCLSGENTTKSSVTDSFSDKRNKEIINYFEMTDKERGIEKVDIDKAWGKVFNRLDEENLIETKRSPWNPILKIAAAIVILIASTFTVKYILNDGNSPQLISVVTSGLEKNRIVELADGSTVTLNRDSRLSFPEKFNGDTRNVELSGEAFFDISHDASKPFIVKAAGAEIRVLGTSFNVLSDNLNNEIEVFVKSGKVQLSSASGEQKITLEPGFIGRLKDNTPVSERNTNSNYMAWNTEILHYDGARLEEVFKDLQKVHNITVEVLSASILDQTISTDFTNTSAETIILSICRGFNLSFEKKGEIYYLSLSD